VNLENDTIVAIATAPGRGGIGIVRLSGSQARAIAEPMLRLRRPLAAGRARLAELLDRETGAVLDQGVVTFFAAPNSYTSEDVVEIAAHGAPVLLEALLRQCVTAGARLARPGEFTERAFLAGRLDLTQAEAVHDLVAATTLEQARTAARQMGGALSKQVQPVKQALIALIAALEAGVDFAEDDIDTLAAEEIAAKIDAVAAPLREMEASFGYGRLLRDGFTLALVGRPNAGKSSLFNRLVRRNRAIVTASPGTTRDPIHEELEFAGIPVRLIDTAGLRVATDEAELAGMERSREAMAEADIVLLVVAANEALGAEDLEAVRAHENLLVVVNKVDLVEQVRGPAEAALAPLVSAVARTSALTGEGIEALRETILARLRSVPRSADAAVLTNLRQHQAVTAALHALAAAAAGVAARTPHEMLLLDLYEALEALDRLTGTTTQDDVLNLIFSSFCIGK